MDEEDRDNKEKTRDLKKLMKVRKTKKLIYKGIYRNISRQILE
ncbi:MAG: hypothetical protein R6V50_07415 [Thermoplasmatota archaeon]